MAIALAGNPSGAMIPMGPPGASQMINQMVSIGDLLELAIKKTFRDLSLLAELLPRKTDMERKIEIMLFANRNRQLFVRLLSLVKWAGTASKVEKCSQIVSFLDKQSQLFTDTADILARLSREILVTARLPSFQLLAAVEVMTLGTYSRLPTCIRDRLVPPDPIPNGVKRVALLRLNHIIQQRLVSSVLPLQMRNIKIEFGRVTFTVQNEFTLTLTLTSDQINSPWCVLNVGILVEDKEIGGIKDIVQPYHLFHMTNMIQQCVNEASKPLVQAYDLLHSFCLSLQLEVLYVQSLHLKHERLKDYIRIDQYLSGSRIVILYWMDANKTAFKLIIEIDTAEPSKPLQIRHVPELESKTFSTSMQANILSIEKILYFTAHERAKLKLNNLKKLIEEKNSLLTCEVLELPAVLHISFIQPCMPSEQLLISVDMLNGQFLAHVPQYEDCALINELESLLNRDACKERAISLINDLRIWITRERCKKTVEALPVRIMETLPLPPSYSHSILSLPGHKLYFQFTRHHDKCLMAVFDNDRNQGLTIWIKYYLIYVCNVSIESNSGSTSTLDHECPKHYTKILKVLQLDSSTILHNFYPIETQGLIPFSRKRKLVNQKDQSNKRQKQPGYYIADLAHIVSFCDEKLSYSCLSTELHKKKIRHQLVQDANGFTHYIDIIKFPPCVDRCPLNLTQKIQSNTLSCNMRLHGKNTKYWSVLLVFSNPLFQNLPSKEPIQRKMVHNSYDLTSNSQTDKIVEDILNDWTAIARLYDVVQKFADDLKSTTLLNVSLIEVKSFSYKKIVIAYGPSKTFFVSIYYKSSEKRFQLSFGVVNQASSNINPHTITSAQLQYEFNQHHSLVHLLYVLNYTLNPLLTIQCLKSIPLLGVLNSRASLPVLTFAVIPQESNHIRLIYRTTYCLDILMHSDNLISIRDGALSQIDTSKVISDLQPIQGLKAFLTRFVDKTVQMRRLSQTEDDNPPSPITQMDYQAENYMFASIKTEGSSGARGSNPHTPASPLTSVLNPHPNYPTPSPGNFSLSSPPSHLGLQQQIAPSPQMHILDAHSPATLFNINSPMNANLHAPSPSLLPIPSPSAPASFPHSHSPASQFTPQSNVHESIGSPFSQPGMPPSNMSLSSPATNIWPGSPSMSRPSPRPSVPIHSPGGAAYNQAMQHSQFARVPHPPIQSRHLPSKAWAANIPTYLTHQGFEMMCKPIESLPSYSSNLYSYSQLEKFLGVTFMRRQFNKPIEETQFEIVPTAEQGSIMFRNDTLQFKISLDFNTMQSLHLAIKPISDMNQWRGDEIETLQQFFEHRIACPPYKPNSFFTFCRILKLPLRVQKDFIQLMKLDMNPDMTLKWSLQLSLTFPPLGGFGMSGQAGMSAFFVSKNKLLFFIRLTKNPIQGQMMADPVMVGFAMIYDMQTNTIQLNQDRTPGASSIIHNIANNILKRFMDFNNGNMECILYPSVRDLMASLQF